VQEKAKHMKFLEGTYSKDSKEKDKKKDAAKRREGTNKAQRVDPLLKKVMSKVFTERVMNDTLAAYSEIKQDEDGDSGGLSEEDIRD
jgi:hypothetical protein